MTRLDVQLLLDSGLNAPVTGDVTDNAVTITDYVTSYWLTENLAVERGHAFYVAGGDAQHFRDGVNRTVRNPAALLLHNFQCFDGSGARILVMVLFVLDRITFFRAQYKCINAALRSGCVDGLERIIDCVIVF